MNKVCEVCQGACCKGMALDPGKGMTPDERRWLELHGYDSKTRIMLERPCEKLEDGRCSIYDFRPSICKKFVVGSKECLFAVTQWAPDKVEAVTTIMQGVGNGKD